MATNIDKSPLHLLSLDGGGIRGVSELIILNQIMERLQHDLDLPDLPRPCDYFHLIGGTSTGGLIALMLGRLQMNTREALQQYSALAGKIFSKANKKWKVQDGTFKASTLEQEMKHVVGTRSDGNGDAMMIDDHMVGAQPGRALVCAMPARNMEYPRLFRSYKVRENNTPNCHIWEAARATTAAPTFFKRISISEPGGISEEFVDAGIKYNNPAELIRREATHIFDNTRPLGCFVSIGTGQKDTIGLSKPDSFQKILPSELIHVLKDIATDCEATANRFKEDFLDTPDVYFRFNVTHGVGPISLEEWKRLSEIQTHTISYLSDPLISRSIDTVVKILARHGKPQTVESEARVTLGSISSDVKVRTLNDKNFELQQEELHREKIENWLSPLNFTEKQQEIYTQACAGTGEWLLSRPEFKYWVRGDVWELRCYGDAGTGKTVLTSIIVEYLRNSEPASPVLFLYFERHSSIPQTKENLLGSLLKQLIQFRRPGISLDIRKAYEKSNSKPSFEEMCLLLSAEIALYDRVYLVVDALDEANSEVRYIATILDDEEMFFRFSQRKLNVIITLREDEERSPNMIKCDNCGEEDVTLYYSCQDCRKNGIEFDICYKCKDLDVKCVRDATHKLLIIGGVEITIRPPSKEIELYVKSILRKEMGEGEFNDQNRKKSDTSLDGRTIPVGRNLSRLGEECLEDPELADEISIAIVGKADHNFRFAKIYMDFLAEKLTLREIKQVLGSIPDKLKNQYENDMTERISDQDSKNQETALKILSLLCSAKRPLRLEELQHALAVEEGQGILDKEIIINKKGILKITKGLITIDRDMFAAVRPFHVSLLEYLIANKTRWFPDAESNIGHMCLSYLNLEVFAEPCSDAMEFESIARAHPFIAYASWFWGDHVRASGLGSGIEASALSYLRQPRRIAAYVQAAWYGGLGAGDSWDVRRDVDALHVCAWFGLSSLMEALNSDNVDVVEQTYGQTSLIYACRRRHLECVQKLLDLGANVNLRSAKGQTPLFEAIEQNEIGIVKILVAQGDLNINEVNPKKLNRSALIFAVRQGSEDIVQLLLERPKLLINEQDTKGYSALTLAAYIGNEKIVNMILSVKGVDLESVESSDGRSALILAAEQNHAGIVENLLQHGADPFLQDSQGRTALLRAAEQGCIGVVQTLLELKNGDTSVDENGRGSLHGASSNGDPDIISLLIRHGLDVNARDKNDLTPLHEACQYGHLDAIKVLIELGADSSLEDNFHRTPFTIAWQYGHTSITTLLTTTGSNKAIDAAQDTRPELLPTWSLARLGHYDLLKARLASPTPDTTSTEPYNNSTPIHCAVIANQIPILELLLQQGGPPPDSADRNKCTALFLASNENNLAATTLLLASSLLSLNTPNRWGDTPLSIACAHGDWDVALELVKAGAAVDVANGAGAVDVQALLVAAVERDELGVVERLVRAGADVLGQDVGHRTALQVARAEGGVVDGALVKMLGKGKSFYVPLRKKGVEGVGQGDGDGGSVVGLVGRAVGWFWGRG